MFRENPYYYSDLRVYDVYDAAHLFKPCRSNSKIVIIRIYYARNNGFGIVLKLIGLFFEINDDTKYIKPHYYDIISIRCDFIELPLIEILLFHTP